MDTERQIKLDFLSEAEAYLDSLESLLLDLDAQGAETSLLDTAMRSAHSLKGGAAMMRLVPLSQIAHRLEDFLKILRVRQDDSLIDKEVTNLLLQGVDCMRTVRDINLQLETVDPDWLAQNAEPIFERLRKRLGDLKEEDEDLLLAEEEQIDVSSLIFQSGVEDCLQSFKSQIDSLDSSQLQAELEIQAEQLAEFGLMSQIEPFVQLCQSVQQEIAITPLEQIEDLARQALKLWERSHALVLVGRIDKLPTTVNGDVASAPSPEPEADIADIGDFFADAELSELAELQSLTAQQLSSDSLDFLETDFYTEDAEQAESSNLDPATPEMVDLDRFAPDESELSELDAAFASLPESTATPEMVDLDRFAPDESELSELDAAFAEIEQSDATLADDVPATSISQTLKSRTEQGRMIRVPAEQLQRLNDLSSKLILERNAAMLRLSQIQDFVSLTRDRMRRLEQSSSQLRKLYDWASLEGMLPTAQPVGVATDSTWEPASNTATEKFDALEMDRYSDLHLLSQEQMETIVQLQEVTTDIDFGVREMGQVVRDFSYTTREIQQTVTRSQMRPFAELVGRFPRLIRDLSSTHNKQVELVIEGNTTQIDRQAIESLSDPLTHLLRNAFDHGLEDTETRIAAGKSAVGIITIKAEQKGNRTVITIADDGGGIDTRKIRDRLVKMGLDRAEVDKIDDAEVIDAIFEPGFSTAAKVTELSGRGVGMDVVRSNLKQIRGDIQVKTKLGVGTTFTITVPLSLLVLRVVIVESNSMVFAVPVYNIKEIIEYSESQIASGDRQEFITWQNRSIALIRPKQYLEYKRPSRAFEMSGTAKIQQPTVLIFEEAEQFYGIYLEKYWNEQEVAIRAVNTSIPLFPGFTGSTILGDGRVIPLIEPSAFYRGILKQQRAALNTSVEADPQILTTFPTVDSAVIMIVDDSVHVRRYLAGVLERNGYLVEEAKDGQDAVDKLQGGLRIDAVICDVEMPRLDGYGVLSEIKSESRFEDLPIAMLTSRSNQKHRQLAMNLGASAYFSKPFNEQELLQTLKTLIVR